MNAIERIIEAIIQGAAEKAGTNLDDVDKITLQQIRQGVLESLIPALPILEEIKAAAWTEGHVSNKTDKNPYQEA